MEKRQIQHLISESNELPGIWDKSWVRPYESIWSILNNYKCVNVIHDHATLMKAIGTDISASIVKDYFLSYGIFCNISCNKNDIDSILSQLVPEWYKQQIEDITMQREISDFFTDKISYCRKCMKNGYHSILHQLKGIKKCPFHRNESMFPYLKQRYIFGAQSLYIGDHKNSNRLKNFACRNMTIVHTMDFENPSHFPLPIDRKDMPEIAEFFRRFGLRRDFDYIKPVGTDIFDKNIIPDIGSFLLDYDLKPEIIIQNANQADAMIIEKMKKRISRSGLEYEHIVGNNHQNLFKYIYMQVFINEKLMSYTPDEIDYKCYQIERGKFISYSDELGILLLYLLFLTGDERIEESLNRIKESMESEETCGWDYKYHPSEICIHELEINNFCISAQYYILEDFLNTNLVKFKQYAKVLGGMEKPIFRRNLILYPTHIIYTEDRSVIKIYRY